MIFDEHSQTHTTSLRADPAKTSAVRSSRTWFHAQVREKACFFWFVRRRPMRVEIRQAPLRLKAWITRKPETSASHLQQAH